MESQGYDVSISTLDDRSLLAVQGTCTCRYGSVSFLDLGIHNYNSNSMFDFHSCCNVKTQYRQMVFNCRVSINCELLVFSTFIINRFTNINVRIL